MKILRDENLSVLWHSVKILVNFMRRLTSISILCYAYFNNENCSHE